MEKIKDYSLYFIITEEYTPGRSALDAARLAIDGGVDIIQMREKNLSKDASYKMAGELSRLCRKNKVLFIVNDDPVLARDADADGTHLGQEDAKSVTIEGSRRILGRDKIIGLSTGSVAEVIKANSQDVDYIGFGPVFPTVIKDGCVGTEDVENVLRISKKPVVFIGGINLTNMDELLEKGAKNIALIRGISEAGDITAGVKKFKKRLEEAKNGKITRIR